MGMGIVEDEGRWVTRGGFALGSGAAENAVVQDCAIEGCL